MNLDYATLDSLRQSHPAWRLLRADQAPVIVSFLHKVFIQPNVRVMSQSNLSERLEDELYGLRLLPELQDKFPKEAGEYLNDWAAAEKGWLRKFYPPDSDEPHFDLMPATEKAIGWLASLTGNTFVGTESRLLLIFQLLKQMTEGTETDSEIRLADLMTRRREIDQEIERVKSGDMNFLGDTAIRDRFQQFVALAQQLLLDFREVEANFRALDRQTRERIAMWDKGKGELLGEILGERDAISDSDQGRSFQAFWDFLMSQRRQDEFTQMLERVLALPAVSDINHNARLNRIHYDWLTAGENTQKTVALLSQQLRRFLDDAALLENRYIIDKLRNVEKKALNLRHLVPKGDFMEIDADWADIDLPMERPLFKPAMTAKLSSKVAEASGEDVDPAALFSQVVIEKEVLRKHIRVCLQTRSQITLAELVRLRPLEHGLAELLAYMQLATDELKSTIDDQTTDTVSWLTVDDISKHAQIPRVIIVR